MNDFGWLKSIEKFHSDAIWASDAEFIDQARGDINRLIIAVKSMKKAQEELVEAMKFYADTSRWRSNIDMRGDVIEEFRTNSSKHLFGCDRAHEALLKIEKYATKKA